MMVILPFEKNFYQRWNYPVDYVGHPLIEIIEDYKKNNDPVATKNNLQIEEGKKIIAVSEGFLTPAKGDVVINLKDRTVMPGLIDSHVHLEIVTDSAPDSDAVISSLRSTYKCRIRRLSISCSPLSPQRLASGSICRPESGHY